MQGMHRRKTKLDNGNVSVFRRQNNATNCNRGWQGGPEAGINVLRTANRERLVVTQVCARQVGARDPHRYNMLQTARYSAVYL